MDLEADLIPFRKSEDEAEVEIEIYVVTGRHGLLKIPESFCKECNLFYQSARKAAERADKGVNIEVKSYWTRFLRPLIRGGYHPPVMLVNGKKIAQGYDVPEVERLIGKIEELR